jgi:hypothetical protein
MLALRTAVASIGCLLVGCTGTSSAPVRGTCSVEGTVDGVGLDAQDCFSRQLASDPDYSAHLTITDYVNACSMDIDQQIKAKSSTIDVLFVGSPPLATGTYSADLTAQTGVAQTHVVDVNLTRYDGSCMIASTYPADGGEPILYPLSPTGGSLTVTRSDSSGISGTFDLTFGTDELTGTFDAPTCGPQTQAASCVQ